jgi:hypothetical protein
MALLVILWTSRNRIALLLRSVLLLFFSMILLPTLAFAIFWLGSEVAPALVAFSAVMISLNFAFYYCIENDASGPRSSVPISRCRRACTAAIFTRRCLRL